MSERGSFVTEYINCNRCIEAVADVLLDNQKFLCSARVPGWNGGSLPIIAGKIGGGWAGEEIFEFETVLLPKLAKVICHEVRVAVLAEKGQQIFWIRPGSPSTIEAMLDAEMEKR